MTPIFLEFPSDRAERAAWLERRLVGGDLADFVNELVAIQSRATGRQAIEPPPTLDAALSANLIAVFQQGLSVLGERELRLLIRHPSLLLELQGRVLQEGGTYWDALPRDEAMKQLVDRQWRAISRRLDDDPQTNDSPVVELPKTTAPSRTAMPQWIAGGLVAALLLVAAAIFFNRPQDEGWGFDRAGLLAADVEGADYLRSLADAGGAWFNKRPEDREALAKRLHEFIDGCDTLIAAPHRQLDAADREWLVERCKAWKGALEGLLADLERERAGPGQTRDAADAVVRKLQRALRERAEAAA